MSEHGARMALAMMSALGGPVSFPHWKRRLALVPNPERESAAQAKRARKAAKRERDAERTREGRVTRFCGGGIWFNLLESTSAKGLGRGRWDSHATHWRIHHLHPKLHGPPEMREPRWRQRAAYRRSLPMPHPWCDCLACRAARSR